MKLILSKEDVAKINNILTTAKISYGYDSKITGKREIVSNTYPQPLIFNKEKGCWETIYNSQHFNFRNFLVSVVGSNLYKTSNKRLKELAHVYIQCQKNNDEAGFHTYLDQLGCSQINIENVDITEDVTEWIKQHVQSISARFPSKYERHFTSTFPKGRYCIDDRTWNYSFWMSFDTLKGIPEELLNLKNKNGNSIDVKSKRLCNTSYIWKFVLDNPEFPFGYHRD